MTWHKNECFQLMICNQCRRPGAEYSREADEVLCEECLPWALEQIKNDQIELPL